MSRCGIEIRGRSRQLRVNYRTTAEVRAFAVSALTGLAFDDLDGGEDTLDGYRSIRVGRRPEIVVPRTAREEQAFVVERVRRWLAEGVPPEAICLAAPTIQLVHARFGWLQGGQGEAPIPATVVEPDGVEGGHGVRVATFHRLKGLEFPRVILTGVQEGLVPSRAREYHELSADDRVAWDRRQRCLLYVAASRARDELVVTGWGAPSPLVGPSTARGS